MTESKSYIPLVHNFLQSLVPELSDRELNQFTTEMRVSEFGKSSFFVRIGQIPTEIGFVIRGIFKVFYTDSEGKEYIRTFRPEFTPVGAYSCFLQKIESDVNIQALEDSKVALVPYNNLMEIFESSFAWQKFGRLIAEEYMIKREIREKQFLIEDAKERYLKFLEEYNQYADRIPSYDIAAYLGINPASLSRLKREV